VRSWDRRFEQIKKRYKDFAGIALSKLPSWDQVLHAQELRNALVHNQGQYTRAYLGTKLAYRPTEEDLHGFASSVNDPELIDHEVIPLSLTLADAVITQLLAAAIEVREAIDQARRS
jgi:arabinogalactan endo-1,4-beta-galactosidase